ncbi:substrate-binding domain-containing protein [Nonomuraea antimicrobica]
MDTVAAADVSSQSAGVLKQLQPEDGRKLVDPSFVLLRIENTGTKNIDTHDYAVLDDDKVGIRITFPGRRLAGMVVTELSDDFLRHSFGEDSGLTMRDGIIELPKVPLNHSQHYKVLAALERAPDNTSGSLKFEDPRIVGGIKGGVGSGGIRETKSRTGTSWRATALIGFLVVIIALQLGTYLRRDSIPLDCATGTLTLTGSTAFDPVLREAAASYRRTCPGAGFAFELQGSGVGIRALDEAGRKNASVNNDRLAFSDGPKAEGFPKLLPRPIALSLFTLVISKEAGVQDLSLDQIKQIYDERVTTWKELGGNDQPVRFVDRHSDSGTRKAFEQKILGEGEPGDTSDDCLKRRPDAPPGIVRCVRGSTDDVLDAVANTPGAIGYSEVGAAFARSDLLTVRINGHRATPEAADYGAYPFWETEYAYTYGEPKADSLAASFLRYLTNEVGKDIVRSHSHRPCGELQNPELCHPPDPAPSSSPLQ